MSEPVAPPPPPPPPYQPPPPPPTGGGAGARQQVQGPALGIIIVAALGILLALVSVIFNLLGVGMSGMPDLGGGPGDRWMQMASGGFGIVWALLALAAYGAAIWGAMQMREMKNWTLSVAASILVMLPCGCVCIAGIPIGIWSLVVLMRPEVKGAFAG